MPKNDQIWPKTGIFGEFGPGHAGLFSALLVGRLVVVARGLYLARHLFTLLCMIVLTEKNVKISTTYYFPDFSFFMSQDDAHYQNHRNAPLYTVYTAKTLFTLFLLLILFKLLYTP